MISIDEQQSLLLNAARRLKKKITVYAIGGTAMMFLGSKDSTLDIDLVFETEKARDSFREAITALGYKEMDAIKVYGAKKNQPKMFTRADERFDLFVRDNIIDFIFSENMQERSEHIHQFDENLFLKIADPHDIILMKCATDRLKDADDARKMIDNNKIDWDIIVAEAKNQVSLGKETAVFNLGEFLEKLKYNMKVDIPKEVLDSLFRFVEEQAKEKQK